MSGKNDEEISNKFENSISDVINNEYEENESQQNSQNLNDINEFNDDLLEYTQTNTKEDLINYNSNIFNNFYNNDNNNLIKNNNNNNYNSHSSSISLIQEFENKWEQIENEKKILNLNLKKKHLYKNSIKKNPSNNNNNNKLIKIKTFIDNSKKNFLKRIEKEKENKLNSFENFVFLKIKEMDKFIIKDPKLLELINKREIIINNNNNDNKSVNYNNNYTIKEVTEEDESEENNNNNNKINKNINKKRNNSFLIEDKRMNKKYKIPLQFRGNNFNCIENTKIEGLVYETPDDDDINNNNYSSNKNLISESLKNKMKNVFDDINKPSIIFNNTINESLFNNNNSSNTNDFKEFNSNNNKYNSLNNDLSINSNYISNNNNVNDKSLYSLEKNFDEILNKINPNLRNKGNNFIIKKEEYYDEYNNNNSNNENNILNLCNLKEINNPDLEKYFEELSIEAGYKLPKYKHITYNNNNNYNTNNNNNNNINEKYIFSNDLSDQKLNKKIEENIKLLNRFANSSDNNNKDNNNNNFYNKILTMKNKINNNNNKYNEISLLNKSYMRNHSLNFSNILNKNTNNTTTLSSNSNNYNQIFQKNNLDDSLLKIYQSKALKIQKILNQK